MVLKLRELWLHKASRIKRLWYRIKRFKYFELIVLTSIVIIGFLVYMNKQLSSPLLFGIDGPYYYIQVRSLIESGNLKYLDPPLAFYILTGFSLLLNNIVLGIKVGSVLVVLTTTYILYYLVKNMTKSSFGGLIASILFIFSPYLTRMSFDLIKNAMGLLFLSLTFLLVHYAVKKYSYRYALLASVSIILTGLTHIIDFGLALAFLWIYLLFLIRDKRRTILLIPCVISIAMLILGFSVPLIMGYDPYKGILFVEDLVKNKNLPMKNFPLIEVLRLTVYPLCIGIAGISLAIRNEFSNYIDKIMLLIFSILIILLNIPFIPLQYLWRFNLMSAILSPIILGVLIGLIKDLRIGIALSIILLGMFIPQFILQINMIRPSISLREYEEIQQLIYRIPNDTIIIAPNTKLRYWIETIYPDVVKSLKDISMSRNPMVLVFERHELRKPPLPPKAKPLFIGRYIEAYILPPKRFYES